MVWRKLARMGGVPKESWFQVRRAVHGCIDAALLCADLDAGVAALAMAYAIAAHARGRSLSWMTARLHEAANAAGVEVADGQSH